MFIDASVIVALITREADHADLTTRLNASAVRLTSAVALFEATLGVARKLAWTPSEAQALVEEFLKLAEVEVIAIDRRTWLVALQAFERFGKGLHPAGLNMGDCFAYACARTEHAALLFKGDDFTKTDIAAA